MEVAFGASGRVPAAEAERRIGLVRVLSRGRGVMGETRRTRSPALSPRNEQSSTPRPTKCWADCVRLAGRGFQMARLNRCGYPEHQIVPEICCIYKSVASLAHKGALLARKVGKLANVG